MDKIVCLGKNYLEHARELGDAVPERPVLFLKPPSVLVSVPSVNGSATVSLPDHSLDVHHECEVVLRVGADRKIEAVTLGLDMTLRDIQSAAKKNGHPWTVSKVFAGSAIVGPFVPIQEFPGWESTAFSLSVNGQLRQKGQLNEAVVSATESLTYIEEFFPLCPGDLVFTGTPKGVNSVSAGDKAALEWGSIHYTILWQRPPQKSTK